MHSYAGAEVATTAAAAPNTDTPIQGQFVSLELLTQDHCRTLWHQFGFADGDFSVVQWVALLSQPKNADELWQVFEGVRVNRGLITYAIVGDPGYVNHTGPRSGATSSSTKEALGMIGYLDIDTKHRSLETGAVIFSKKLQRSAAATEAHYLQLRNVFEPIDGTPYRRVAWKNNSLNYASRRAAQRIGYHHEGTFRNHWILNGRSRDSDFLSVIEEEWPVIKLALERWLDEKNFDAKGRQVRTLDDIRDEYKKQAAP